MVIESLENSDIPLIEELIANEPEVNLFIFGDIANFGIDDKHVTVYGVFKDNKLVALLLRYMQRNYVFYAKCDDYPVKELAQLIKEQNPTLEGVSLSGKASLIEPFKRYLSPLKIELTKMARCNQLASLGRIYAPDVKCRLLTRSDFQAMWNLEKTIEEFASSTNDVNYNDRYCSFLAGIERGSLNYGVYVNNKLVALASTTASSKESAMLVGVCTAKEYRRHGYASLAVYSLLKDCFTKGLKFVCLFYDNPNAGKIYHSFGFKDVDDYSLLH